MFAAPPFDRLGTRGHTGRKGDYGHPGFRPAEERYVERDSVVQKALYRQAGFPAPEDRKYHDLGSHELPVYQHKDDIQTALRDHKISMLEGETGSGKSTQIIQYALEMGFDKIIMLEPTRLTADNISDRVQFELGEQLGHDVAEELIGVRHSQRSTGRGKQIEVMTPGTFIRVIDELETFADKRVLVGGDEIHKDSFDTDFALALYMMHMQDRPKSRAVLVSATLDPDPIHNAYSELNRREIPITSAGGRPHGLATHHRPDLTGIEALREFGPSHNQALIFEAGKREISHTVREINRDQGIAYRAHQLHAGLTKTAINSAIHAQPKEGEGVAIASTNVAEDGITIAGTDLVITDGMSRRRDLDEDGVPGLFKVYDSQNQIIQQFGRAGRDVAGGQAVLVAPSDEHFPYMTFEDRDKHAPAEIYHTNISTTVLIAALRGRNFFEVNKYLKHRASERSIISAYDTLYQLGATDEENKITETGRRMATFPVPPEFARTLVEAERAGSSNTVKQHLAATTSAVAAGGLPSYQKEQKAGYKQDIRHETTDDYMAELDMFYATRRFYHGHYLDQSELTSRSYNLKSTEDAHRSFDKIMSRLGLDHQNIAIDPPLPDEVRQLHDFITAGMIGQVYTKTQGGRTPRFANVHSQDPDKSFDLGRNSIARGEAPLVIATPRRYEKVVKGELDEFREIHHVLPTTAQALARHALRAAQRQPGPTKVVGGRLVVTNDLYLGSIHVGEEVAQAKTSHTPETRHLLIEAAFNKQIESIQELTSIKKQLEYLVRRAPKSKQSDYFPRGIFTNDQLQGMVEDTVTDNVDSIYDIENSLRAKIVRGNLSIRDWISKEYEDKIVADSPDYIDLPNVSSYELNYRDGQPLITRFNRRDLDLLPDHIYLEDGREVLINQKHGGLAEQLSVEQLKERLLRDNS